MEIRVLVAVLVAAATQIAKMTAAQPVQDAYGAVKAVIGQTFGADSDVSEALRKVEEKPESPGRAATLEEELAALRPQLEGEIMRLALRLQEALAQGGGFSSSSAINTGSGAIAQGVGNVAAGRGGVSVGGNVSGGQIFTGDTTIQSGTHIANDYIQGDKVLGDKIGRQINTGGGAFVRGNVTVSGGDFVGRDQINYAASTPDDQSSPLSAEGQKLASLLVDYFTPDELRDISEQLGQNWNRIQANSPAETAKALIIALERSNELIKLKRLMRVARPKLRNQLS